MHRFSNREFSHRFLARSIADGAPELEFGLAAVAPEGTAWIRPIRKRIKRSEQLGISGGQPSALRHRLARGLADAHSIARSQERGVKWSLASR